MNSDFLVFMFPARGFDEHAALQPAVSSRELSDEVLLLPRPVLATGL